MRNAIVHRNTAHQYTWNKEISQTIVLQKWLFLIQTVSLIGQRQI